MNRRAARKRDSPGRDEGLRLIRRLCPRRQTAWVVVVRPELLWISSHVSVSERRRLARYGEGLVRCDRGRSLRPSANGPSQGPCAQRQDPVHDRSADGTRGRPVSHPARPPSLGSEDASPGCAARRDEEQPRPASSSAQLPQADCNLCLWSKRTAVRNAMATNLPRSKEYCRNLREIEICPSSRAWWMPMMRSP